MTRPKRIQEVTVTRNGAREEEIPGRPAPRSLSPSRNRPLNEIAPKLTGLTREPQPDPWDEECDRTRCEFDARTDVDDLDRFMVAHATGNLELARDLATLAEHIAALSPRRDA